MPAGVLRSLHFAALRLAQFRSVSFGAHVKFLGVSNVYVNLSDARGRAVIANAGVTQPVITYAWRRLASIVNPTSVLDIGANYGEIGLSSRYGPLARIVLFEANPRLIPYLQRSASSHADADRIVIIPKLVSNVVGAQRFCVDHKWSGTSSAAGAVPEMRGTYRGPGEERAEWISVPATTIDAVDAVQLDLSRLLFKVDVEGYEGHVLTGMAQTLQSASAYAGILEFDRRYLRYADTDPDDFLRQLKELGTVLVLSSRALVQVADSSSVPDHVDLLLVSPSVDLSGFRIPST